MKKTELQKKLKVGRTIKDMTQAQAAEAIGVSLRTYIRWEKGETLPKWKDRKEIEKAFEIDHMELSMLIRKAKEVR